MQNRRVVGVKGDNWTIAFGGEILPESEIEIDHSLPHKVNDRAGANTGISYEYGSYSMDATILDIEDHSRNFSLPGEAGEAASLLSKTSYPPGQEHRRRAESIYIDHLYVEDEYRQEGLGAFLFDMYRAVAIYIDGRAEARVGGGEETAKFFERMGVPSRDISFTTNPYGPGDAAYFDTAARNLRSGPVQVDVTEG